MKDKGIHQSVLMTDEDLGERWGKSPASIRSDASRAPWRLPPICRLPGKRGLRWRLEDVEAFEEESVDYARTMLRPASRKHIQDPENQEAMMMKHQITTSTSGTSVTANVNYTDWPRPKPPTGRRWAPGEEGQTTVILLLYADGTFHAKVEDDPQYFINYQCFGPKGKHHDAIDCVELFKFQAQFWPNRIRIKDAAEYGPEYMGQADQSRILRKAYVQTVKIRLWMLAAMLARRAGWTMRDDHHTEYFVNAALRPYHQVLPESMWNDPALNLFAPACSGHFDLPCLAGLEDYRQIWNMTLPYTPDTVREPRQAFIPVEMMHEGDPALHDLLLAGPGRLAPPGICWVAFNPLMVDGVDNRPHAEAAVNPPAVEAPCEEVAT